MQEMYKTYERPWGFYKAIHQRVCIPSGQTQTKLLCINPGQSTSLQTHARRAEHWTVVQGQPIITLGETKRTYGENTHLYIPAEQKHRIENFTDIPVLIIETQMGDYLGEDDIVRLEDVYKRG